MSTLLKLRASREATNKFILLPTSWQKVQTLISEWERLLNLMTENHPPSNNAFDQTFIREAEPAEYSAVLNQLMANSLVGQSQLWPRGELVQPHKPISFKPDTNLYRDIVKKDRRNGKELEYIHSAGKWLEQGLSALELFKTSPNAQTQGRLLHISEIYLQASKELLAIRTSHYHAILAKGPTVAKQLADLVETKVEASHAQIASDNYSTVYKELSAKYVVAAAKKIARNEVAPKGGASNKK